MKRFLCVFLCLILTLTCLAAGAESTAAPAAPTTHQLEKKTVPLYLENYGKVLDEVPLWLIDGVKDLPYMELGELTAFLNTYLGKVYDDGAARYEGSYSAESKIYTLSYKPTGAQALFLVEKGEIHVTDYELLNAQEGAIVLDVLNATGFNPNTGKPELFQRLNKYELVRPGDIKVLPLSEYGISYVEQDGKILLPMQTLLTLFVARLFGGFIAYNGQGLYLGDTQMFGEPGALTELGTQYYSAPRGDRSRQLAEYGLNELCLELDCFYGLKATHNIKDFYSLIFNAGLMEDLLSPNAQKADQAVMNLINLYLDDLHSSYLLNSPLTGADTKLEASAGYSAAADANFATLYQTVEKGYFPAGRPAYQEIGDTAYVTFNSFLLGNGIDYYSLDLNDEESIQDTISLIMYAHHQITRQDSPIKNVVLDLSLNIGGQADAAVFVISWFLGEAQVSVQSTFTGAQGTNVYRADVNADREFDEKDTVYLKNLYCLISPESFSCGNLVPWVFHASGIVTLIGNTSGGGSCIVMPMCTAWGTIFQSSGPNRLAFIKNGSFYDIDLGVEPDVHLTRPNTYYDRDALTKIIHDLY